MNEKKFYDLLKSAFIFDQSSNLDEIKANQIEIIALMDIFRN